MWLLHSFWAAMAGFRERDRDREGKEEGEREKEREAAIGLFKV